MGKRRRMTQATRLGAYAASRYLDSEAEAEIGVQIPFDVYLQDPQVADTDPKFGFEELMVRWEPGLSDGPTSSRFAVVDYNGDTRQVAPMAKWDAKQEAFLDQDNRKLDRDNHDSLQFDQVNVWALLQRALAFFEGGQGLGRPIPFGFDGNRLIVVPHAGYGRNAFYDRRSKSLQFYYFDDDGSQVRTCQSTDIINHEFGHAVLDGIRPHLISSPFVESAAFHEFVGDLTAILIILRNSDFRRRLADATGGDLSGASQLSAIAEQFGAAIKGTPYLRSAINDKTMSEMANEKGPHRLSEVMTGAMFDILRAFAEHYLNDRERTPRQAFWDACQRMQRTAVQPLDLLPPVDVTFKDYALAVLRAEELSNPTDPYGYFDMMTNAFHRRGILSDEDLELLQMPRYLYDRLRLDVFHDIDDIARSRAAAYRFLNDNRESLLIPRHQDVVVADLYDANKSGRQARRLPRQIILVYIWAEDVPLHGEQFGEYDGETTKMLCGGTLVFDEHGGVLSWACKPGTERGSHKRWDEAATQGEARRDALLQELAERIAAGQIGAVVGSARGMLGSLMPPVQVRREDGALRFELSPHLSLSGEDYEHYEGGRRWEISS